MADEKTPGRPNIPLTPFRFDDPRQRSIYERLSRLVGPSAADFYTDACRLMSGSIEPPLAATTNLVGHMLREIEGSLREVLAPLAKKDDVPVEPIDDDKCASANKSSHADEIKSVLTMLDISEDDELAKTWLAFAGKKGRKTGLQKYAHRRGLRAIRPIDTDFKELWLKMDVIFYGVLDKFESRYVLVFKAVEKLAKKANPTAEDAAYFVSSIPNNYVSHSRFFENLTDSTWLVFLRAENVFKDPPVTEYGYEDGSRTIRYPLWPAATYLLKMAPSKHIEVRDILLEVIPTDNANVKNILLDVATALPLAERLSLMEKIKEWVRAEHSMYISNSASSIIRKFVEDGDAIAAIEVAKTLLELTADKQEPVTLSAEHTYTPAPKPRGRLDEWQYGHFMREEFAKILAMNPDAALDLVIGLLADFAMLGHPEEMTGEETYHDLSCISRPAVENHSQNHFADDLEDHLVEAVRDAATVIVKADPSRLEEIVNLLEQKKWTIFRRIAMHLVVEAEKPNPEIVRKMLLNIDSLEDSDVKHEYARLLGAHFDSLRPDSKKTIYKRIDDANDISERIASEGEGLSQEDGRRIKENWQLQKLTLIGEHLDPEWKAKREALVAKYSEPAHPDFAAYSESFSGPISTVHAADLAEMEAPEIINLLKTWVAPDSHRSFGPTKEGLARELGVAIRTRPEFFEALAKDFEHLDPTYIRSFIQTFHELSQNGRSTDWLALLGLCEWVVEQPRAIPGRTGEILDQDPDWGWARGAITSFIATGLNRNAIPYEHHELVWQIVVPLTEDPNPTPEDESKKDKIIEDAYAHAINTVRGYAIQMAIEYGLWVRKNSGKDAEGASAILKELPELQEILDKHLADPSIAVRAVYGRFIPWLLQLDDTWAKSHMSDLFPMDGFKDPLYQAAWNAYLLYVPVYNDVFDTLRAQYTSAVSDLSSTPYSEKNSQDPQRKLAEHLIVMYWRGALKLDDSLLSSFWQTADDALREHAMDFIGMNLRNNEDELTSELEGRLRLLWESRVAAAQAATDKSKFQKEMSGFGWWFASEKFEEGWACEEYLKAFEFGSKTRTHHFVAEALVKVATTRPLKAAEILSRFIDLNQPSWMLMGDKEEVFGVLRAALQSGDPATQKLAREIISRLIARGYSEYADLLKEFPEEL